MGSERVRHDAAEVVVDRERAIEHLVAATIQWGGGRDGSAVGHATVAT
jgi:hypothetical protein